MKKIFAICAVALAAGAMFTSCNKDKVADNAMTVTLGEEKWEATEVYVDVTLDAATKDGNENIMAIAGSNGSYTDPNTTYVQGFTGKEAGNYGMSNGYVIGYFENENDVDAEGYGNWQATAASQELTNVDLNAKTIEGTIDQTMKNEKQGLTDVAMKVQLTNVEWTVRDIAKNGKLVK